MSRPGVDLATRWTAALAILGNIAQEWIRSGQQAVQEQNRLSQQAAHARNYLEQKAAQEQNCLDLLERVLEIVQGS